MSNLLIDWFYCIIKNLMWLIPAVVCRNMHSYVWVTASNKALLISPWAASALDCVTRWDKLPRNRGTCEIPTACHKIKERQKSTSGIYGLSRLHVGWSNTIRIHSHPLIVVQWSTEGKFLHSQTDSYWKIDQIG